MLINALKICVDILSKKKRKKNVYIYIERERERESWVQVTRCVTLSNVMLPNNLL